MNFQFPQSDPAGTGKYLTQQEAKHRLDLLIQKLSDPDTAVLGHLFGLDKIKEFINRIDNYSGEGKITGVRIYRCIDENRDYPDKNDVFLIPVLDNGQDLYTVYTGSSGTVELTESGDDDDDILGDPRPCPNMCTD